MTSYYSKYTVMIDSLHEIFLIWLKEYGSFALFAMLALGIIALPIPEEGLMVFAGVLMRKGNLFIIPTILGAYAGAITGISVSYMIGRWGGKFLLKKYGDWHGLSKKIDKLHDWFRRFGKWTLFFGYFIPGVRHFTGVAAGIGKLEYRSFALFAYSGAIVWASVFLAIGYFFNQYLTILYKLVRSHIDTILTVLILSLLFYFWYQMKHEED